MASKLDKLKQELKELGESLPFKDIEIPEFRTKSFEPGSVRQERSLVSIDSSMQAVGRFLAERGVVELLKPEDTLALFTEIHWCAWNIRLASRRRYTEANKAEKDVVDCRRMISRMEQAEEELFIANRRLVVACVKPYYWIGQVWLADFLQEGSRALSNAIRKFDFTRGTPFYAYAQKSIQNRMRNYFRDHVRSGSLGIRPTEEMMRIKQFTDRWKEEHGDEPPPSIIASMTEIPEEKVIRLRPLIAQWERMPYPPMSLDAVVGDSSTEFYELIEDPDAEDSSFGAERAEIWQMVDLLPERSAMILKMRFIEGRTLEETGQTLNLTRARIKQIQDDALRKLRHMLRNGPRGI